MATRRGRDRNDPITNKQQVSASGAGGTGVRAAYADGAVDDSIVEIDPDDDSSPPSIPSAARQAARRD